MLTLTAHIERISRSGRDYEIELKIPGNGSTIKVGPLPETSDLVTSLLRRAPTNFCGGPVSCALSVSLSIAEPPAPAAVAEPEAAPKPRKRKE